MIKHKYWAETAELQETTAKGTDLAKSPGEQAPVELESSPNK